VTRTPSASGSLSRAAFDAQRWECVLNECTRLCETDSMPAIALQAVHRGQTTGVQSFGRHAVATGSPPLRDDAIFLVASLTKPIVAMAVLRLVERGRLALNDRVAEFIPEFDAPDRRAITVRHLLTHTSGLPDMLPNNVSLRRSHAPLAKFVQGSCAVTLDFAPGRGMQYQSMGYALLGDIIQRVSGVPCAEFLRRELFEPLGMRDTSLGVPDDWYQPSHQPEAPARRAAVVPSLEPKVSRIAEVRLPPEQEGGDDWNWNSRYWRQLGAPWGGILSTPHDLLLFCRMMLDGDTRLFSPATVAAATCNQLDCLHDLPEADRRTRAWGFGWRLNWPAHSASFGDLLSPQACGHWGATGTLFWIDPPRDAAAVILSTQPLERSESHLTRLSNMIAAAQV
jgi:CubicO group peptidase (beta-lactamase class C family)